MLAVSIPAGADLMTERRRAARQGGFKAGMIESGQAGGVRCMIRNISSTGAFLELAAPTDLHDKFVLVVLSDHRQRNCEVVWRQRHRFGVAFTGREFFGSSRRALVRAAIAASVAR